MGVEFTTRCKVNLFIEGLDPTYEFAINRMQQHMMTWKKDDPTPPDDLQIPVLACTVEKIMMEVTGSPTVRAFTRQSLAKNPPTQERSEHKQQRTRQYVDIQCSFCNAYGHKKYNCENMAIWLLLNDTSKHLDEKQKSKLIDQYTKSMSEKCNRCLKRLKGKVRQLYTTSQMEEAGTIWSQCLTSESVIKSDDSDGDNTTSWQPTII